MFTTMNLIKVGAGLGVILFGYEVEKKATENAVHEALIQQQLEQIKRDRQVQMELLEIKRRHNMI